MVECIVLGGLLAALGDALTNINAKTDILPSYHYYNLPHM